MDTALLNQFSVAIIILICRVWRLVVQLWEFFTWRTRHTHGQKIQIRVCFLLATPTHSIYGYRILSSHATLELARVSHC